jgi:hypothetical protein
LTAGSTWSSSPLVAVHDIVAKIKKIVCFLEILSHCNGDHRKSVERNSSADKVEDSPTHFEVNDEEFWE